jgi:hypothetical protein
MIILISIGTMCSSLVIVLQKRGIYGQPLSACARCVITALSKLTGTRLPTSYTKNRSWVGDNGQVVTEATVSLIAGHNDDTNIKTCLAPVVTPETFDTERLSSGCEETLHKHPAFARELMNARSRNGTVNPRFVTPLSTCADQNK